jgi:protein SCO1
MSRGSIRSLGIILGVLAGTIAALTFRTPFSKKHAAPLDPDEEMQYVAPADPGQRKIIAEMVQGAKKEEGWLKEFEFTERSGKLVKSEDLRGEPYIACFFFSTCPGTCTRQSNRMQLLQNKFKGKPIKFVSISVDPEIDTPEVLAEYAEKFQADPTRWLFFTGDMDYIIKVGTEKFFLGEVKKRGHPDRFCLVNAQGDLVGKYEWQEKEEFDLLIQHANELLK